MPKKITKNKLILTSQNGQLLIPCPLITLFKEIEEINISAKEFILSKNKRKLHDDLKQAKIRGFYAFRSYDYLLHEIDKLLISPLINNNLSKSAMSILINLINEIMGLESIKKNGYKKVSIRCQEFNPSVEIISSNNQKKIILNYKNSYQILGTGKFNYSYLDLELKSKVSIRSNYSAKMVNHIYEIKENYNKWIKETGRQNEIKK